MDVLLVPPAPCFQSFVIIIDNTKVTLNIIKDKGENDYLESSLNIFTRRHIRGDNDI